MARVELFLFAGASILGGRLTAAVPFLPMVRPTDPSSISDATRRRLPWLVAVALFMENLDATIIHTAVPVMSQSLGTDPLNLKGVLTSYALSLAVFIPVSGWMADRYGTRRIFTTAIIFFLIGSILCGLSVNVPMLVVSRVLQGIGGAMMTPVGRVVLVRSFPRSDLIRVTNYVVIPAMIGPLIGPFLGGVFVQWLHWRAIFFVNIPIALLGLWMVRLHMPNYGDEHAPKLDRWGFFLFGGGVALLCYVLEVLGDHSLSPRTASVLLVVGLGLVVAYLWHAKHVAAPMLALWLFRIRTFRVSVAGGFAARLGMAGMPFLLPLLYQIGLGFKPWQAGLLTVPQALAALSTKLFNKSILSRFGHRRVLIVNTVLIGLTMMLFSRIDVDTPLVLILGLSLMQGTFASLQYTSMNTLVYADVSDADASKASSISSTGQQLSISFGVAIASLTAAYFLGSEGRTDVPITMEVLHRTFLVMGCLTILSSSIFWHLRSDDGNSISNRRGADAPGMPTVCSSAPRSLLPIDSAEPAPVVPKNGA